MTTQTIVHRSNGNLANWAVRVVPQRWTGRWIGGIGCAIASDVDGAINSRHAEFTRGTVPDRPYQRVTVNLYADETAWVDGVCERLKRRGLTRATRSEVVRLAITGLRRRLGGLGDPELVNVFLQKLLEDATAGADPETLLR